MKLLWICLLISLSTIIELKELIKSNLYKRNNPNIICNALSVRSIQTRPLGLKYLKAYKKDKKLSRELKEILIGLCLGDLHISKEKPSYNARLSFDQSSSQHSDYLLHLFDLFEPFWGTNPILTNRKPDKRTGLVYNSLRFKTLSFSVFNEFHNLFYKAVSEDSSQVKIIYRKVIPLNLNEYLTGRALAYWCF